MLSPEGYEKKEIDAFLESIGAFVIKPATYGMGKSGASDRVVCIRGTFWSIEIKREGKQPTALQWQRIEETKKAGGRAVWGTAAMVIPAIKAWLDLLIINHE